MSLLDLPSAAASTRARRLSSYGWWELVVVVLLYVGYSASRLLASDDLASAVERADKLFRWEGWTGFAWEQPLNVLFVENEWLGVAGSYYYASAHYLVTAVVLLVLHRRARQLYLPARRALVASTAAALATYVVLPVAPPRLSGHGHVDVLAAYATAGWWGGDASAPRGLGQLTNELAAMPSMHAGWALWVALVVWAWTGSRVWRALGVAHLLVTAVVVVGTGNHWVVDVAAGWLVVLAAWWLAQGSSAMRNRSPSQSRTSVTSSSRWSPERVS